jgi:carbamate kinase
LRVVVGLGGNALLRRGEPLTHEAQHRNVIEAVVALRELAHGHELVVTHGNGPQIGLLAIQDDAIPGAGNFPLDVLSAETEGMIGYLLAQELGNQLPDRRVASILTQVEVAADDPAFRNPTKPVGPVYSRAQADEAVASRGWQVTPDGSGFRRVVPSPAPLRLLEIDTLRLLVDAGTIVVCAGGGGIPVVFDRWGRAHGVEAVVDKDRAAALLAVELGADALLLLTDVTGVFQGWGTPTEELLAEVTPDYLEGVDLPDGSMGPKAEAVADFVRRTGGVAAIGAVEDAAEILRGEAGTQVREERIRR